MGDHAWHPSIIFASAAIEKAVLLRKGDMIVASWMVCDALRAGSLVGLLVLTVPFDPPMGSAGLPTTVGDADIAEDETDSERSHESWSAPMILDFGASHMLHRVSSP